MFCDVMYAICILLISFAYWGSLSYDLSESATWIINHTHCFVWDVITHPYLFTLWSNYIARFTLI